MRYLTVLIVLLYSLNYFGQNNKQDVLAKKLQVVNEDTTKLRLYAMLSNDINKPENNQYGLKAIKLADKLVLDKSLNTSEIKKLKSVALINLGLVALNRGDYSGSIKYFNKSLLLEKGHLIKEAEINNHLALAYKNKNEFFESLSYYEKSLLTYRSIGDKKAEAAIIQEMASIYKMQGNYNKSLENYKNCEQLLSDGKNEEQLAKLNLDIGDVYASSKEYDKAHLYFFKSLSYYKEKGHKSGEANVFNHFGVSYERTNAKKSISNYEKSVKISKSIGDKFTMIQSYTGMAYVYEREKKNNKAIEYYEKSLKLSEEIGYAQGVAEAVYSIEKVKNK